MADARAELEKLRKLKRLKELEAKAGGQPSERQIASGAMPVNPGKYESPGVSSDNSILQNAAARFKDPNQWKAILANQGPAANKQIVEGDIPLAIPVAAVPGVLGKLAQFLQKSPVITEAANIGMGAAHDTENPVRGAATAAAMSAGLRGLGRLLGKGADIGMQAAVGRSKYTPGVGTTLAEEGLIGTQGRLKRQVAEGLANRGQQMKELAAANPEAVIDSPAIAKQIEEQHLKNLIPEGGFASQRDLPQIGQVREFAQDIASRGPESPLQALQRRIAAGKFSYRGSESVPMQTARQLSKSEQQLYSQGLKEAIPEFNEIDPAYAALKKAEASLGKEQSLPTSIFGLLSSKVGANIPGTALGLSAGSQGAAKLGNLLSGIGSLQGQEMIRQQRENELKAKLEEEMARRGL